MNQIKYLLIALILVSTVTASAGQVELIDKIAAVVGNEIILVSEIDFQMQMYTMKAQMQNLSPERIDSLRGLILQQMVSDKLMLIEARRDTSIRISEDQVQEALEQRIDELRNRFTSTAEFEAQMKLEGLTLRELKSKFREEVRNQLIKERFISRFLSEVSVTAAEVREFYEKYQDSLPSQPASVKLAHILLPLEASESTQDSAYLKAIKIKKLLDEGGDFVTLAQLYSQDPTAETGGDLGYFERGTLFAEFEEKVFALNQGEISEPIKTRLGYHIVKVEDKLPDRIHVRHILIKTQASSEDQKQIFAKADSLRQLILDGEAEFSEMVKQYSIDDESKRLGGELGWFPLERVTPEFGVAIEDLEIGDLSKPTKSDFGIHIIKLLDRKQSREMTLRDDWDRIKDFARREKSDRVLQDWLGEVRHETYVDIRI
ncbi:MAG: hypothetical protein GF404_04805 [candidate division Zixibacteria bacterium]|nr:hypothetical protein [candidate division Zixibacteria bacterium]